MEHSSNCPCDDCVLRREVREQYQATPFSPDIVQLCDQAFETSPEWPAHIWRTLRRAPGYQRFAPIAFFREWVNMCDATDQGLPFGTTEDAGKKLLESEDKRQKAEREQADLRDRIWRTAQEYEKDARIKAMLLGLLG